VSTKRKGGSHSKSRSKSTAGRVTPSAKGSPRPRPASSRAATPGATSEATSPRPSEPDLNVAAVDRLVKRVSEALPRGRVRSAFSGTSGLSPNAVTVVGALPGVVVVGLAVATHRPYLLVVAFALMAGTIVALMRFANSTRVVAELSDEMIVFSSRRGTLEPLHRGPVDLQVLPYFDGRWLKVAAPGGQLFVSRRAYGAVVRRLVGPDDALDDEPDDELDEGSDEGG
jgi:hypothetical protein